MGACPLRSIEVANFKSIAHGKVDFKPLTVLVGKNSAGKSSLLQTLRFLSQTAATSKSGIEVSLNGSKLRLGTFEDVHTAGAEGPISLQADLVTTRNQSSDSDGIGPESLLRLEVKPPDTSPERGYAHLSVNDQDILGAVVLWCAEKWLEAVWIRFGDALWRGYWHDRYGSADSSDPYKSITFMDVDWESDWEPELNAEWEPDWQLEWDDPPNFVTFYGDVVAKKWLVDYLKDIFGCVEDNTVVGASLSQACVNDIRRLFAGENLLSLIEFKRLAWEALLNVDDKISQSALTFQMITTDSFRRLAAHSRSDEKDRLLSSLSANLSDSAREIPVDSLCELLASHIGANASALLLKPVEATSDAAFDESLARLLYSDSDTETVDKTTSNNANSDPNSTDLVSRVAVIADMVLCYSNNEIAAVALSMIERGGLWFEDNPYFDEGDEDSKFEPKKCPMTDISKIAHMFALEMIDDEWTLDLSLRQQASRDYSERYRPAVARLLRDRVHYLGPLRQEPRPFFDIDDDDRPDVGAAGQHLARVLQRHGTKTVDVPELGKAELVDGLQYWLRELGVIDDVAVEARGRAGVSIEVRPPDLDRQVDLTSVGVGVSQVLPVLAVCLLADPGDIVLLEQPELHLHPALQMRLADFLLACIKSGRQIIVETHSEHLVNRLRRRVAEDDANNTAELVRIVFAERDAEGHTTFRPSDINPLGGLSQDWPDGFLDLGARDAQKLLQAGLAKQRRLQNT